MPLFEVETDAHIIITWASDEPAAGVVVREAYPHDKVVRMTKRFSSSDIVTLSPVVPQGTSMRTPPAI